MFHRGMPDAATISEADSLLATVIESDMTELSRLITGTEAALLAATDDTESSEDGDAANVTPEAVEPTEILATLEPTAIPPTPIPADVVRNHRSNLLAIINTATAPRGPLSTLQQYWQDVETAGTTLGCRQATPPLPAPYTAIEPEVAAAYPELQQAAQEINDIGLQLLTTGWAAFTNACAQGTLSQQVGTGIITVQTIRGAFDSAQVRLTGLEF